jgi:hypothetical protein
MDLGFLMTLHTIGSFFVYGPRLQDYLTITDKITLSSSKCVKLAAPTKQVLLHWRLLRTRKGYVGHAPTHARSDDKIAMLPGCEKPVLLRPKGKYYELVGTYFVDGYMEGKPFEMLQNGNLAVEEIGIC